MSAEPVWVWKAQPHGAEEVEDLRIEADMPMPDNLDRADGRRLHRLDARAIVNALLASLPGGTVDEVLRMLLEHRASLLRVKW
jgi:hypothetical protein